VTASVIACTDAVPGRSCHTGRKHQGRLDQTACCCLSYPNYLFLSKSAASLLLYLPKKTCWNYLSKAAKAQTCNQVLYSNRRGCDCSLSTVLVFLLLVLLLALGTTNWIKDGIWKINSFYTLIFLGSATGIFEIYNFVIFLALSTPAKFGVFLFDSLSYYD